LTASTFVLCSLSRTLFQNANLRDASIGFHSPKPVDFTGADLQNAALTLGGIVPLFPDVFFSAAVVLTGADMRGCRVNIYKSPKASPSVASQDRTRREQLYSFLNSLSDEQKQQVILTEPELKPLRGVSCFVATAAYGSAMAPQVQLLREFREERLRPRPAGRLLIRAYEWLSPSSAEFIRGRPRLRKLVRWLLSTTLVRVAAR
jgi:hypothetical protein